MPFEGFVIVELMGHSQIAGKASEQEVAGANFLRVDVPAVEGIEAFTKFYSASAIYSITPVDEATCLRAVNGFKEKPVQVWKLAPENPLLAEKIVEPPEDPGWNEWDIPEDDEEDRMEFPDYKVHFIDSVECYTSNSGNMTWKAFDQDGYIIYFRQSNRDMLTEAGLMTKLEEMKLGNIWTVDDAIVHTIEDGDFRKPVQFDGNWILNKPTPKTPDHEKRAIRAAQNWLKVDCVILDTETTGLDDAYPVEVTVIDLEGKPLFNQRIQPPDGIEIEADATKVHGIDAKSLEDCQEWDMLYAEFVATVKDKTVLIYNAEFDAEVIERASTFYKLDEINLETDCVMKVYAEYNGEWNSRKHGYKWVSLTKAIELEGLTVTDAHSALGDCLMTLELVKTLAAKPVVESTDIPF